LLGPVETAVVKEASSRMAAECLPPEAAQGAIYAAAAGAVRCLSAGEAPQPFHPQPPITLAVEFMQPEMADRAALLPGTHRPQSKQIEFTTADVPDAYRAFQALVALAKG
jgi:D-aminopeptidase